LKSYESYECNCFVPISFGLNLQTVNKPYKFLIEKNEEIKPRLRSKRPRTSGQRHQTALVSVKNGLKYFPKILSTSRIKTGGRNQIGKIVTRHIGGGLKFNYRSVDSLWRGHNVMVIGTHRYPLRSAPVSLVLDLDSMNLIQEYVFESQKSLNSVKQSSNSKSDLSSNLKYVTTGEGMITGQILQGPKEVENKNLEVNQNSRCLRSWLPVGSSFYDRSYVSSINNKSNSNAKVLKAAGVYATVLGHGFSHGFSLSIPNVVDIVDIESKYQTESQVLYSLVRFPSGEERRVLSSSEVTMGKVSCEDHILEVIGKAGKRRNLGIRPTVRGCAMNPIDHPHGGRTKGGRHDVTPWASIAKGQSTRSNNKRSKLVLKTARQSKHGYLPSVTIKN